MPAHSETFPWPSYYGHFDFFEKRMAAHSRVDHLQSLGNGLYDLTRSNGKTLKVFVCECYSFGVAEHLEATSKLGHLDAIIIASNWCGYTRELKMQCREDQVGLFDIRGFMAALNRSDFWNYLDEWEETNLKKHGHL